MKKSAKPIFAPNHPTLTRQINPVGDGLGGSVACVEVGAEYVFDVVHRTDLGSVT